jgi:hypothetical protein
MNATPKYEPAFLVPMDDFRKLMTDAFRQGRMSYAIETGKEKAFYSYNALIKKYTRPVVDGWISAKRIVPLPVGNSLRFDKMEVETVAKSDIYRDSSAAAYELKGDYSIIKDLNNLKLLVKKSKFEIVEVK